MTPLSWLIGIPADEMQLAGSLLGTKIAFNEIVAFQEFAKVGAQLSEHTRIMMVYALCSFANCGIVVMMSGVYGALVPERRPEVISLGVKSVIAGIIANLLNATVIGVLI